jgi:SPP1 gp7 family putative phage head morphogenesis protein
MIGKRWEEMRHTLAQDYANTNDLAKQMAFDSMPDVYALNHNYATFEVEKGGKVDTSYTLYDRPTVERLIRDDPKLLPDPRPGSPLAQKLAKHKELRWEEQHVQSVVLQSVLQGESLEQTAKRFTQLTEMNYRQSVRYARTATTGAQNAGRVDGYKRAEKLGVNMKQIWLATLDSRTRHEHRVLDGQEVDVGEPFIMDGFKIKYPGDPAAPAHLLYNCRCTVIAKVKGVDFDVSDKTQRDDKIGDMSYEEWKGEHKTAPKLPENVPEGKADKPAKGEPIKPKFEPAKTKEEAEEYAHKFAKNVNYNGISLENINIINETLTTLTEKYPINQLEYIKQNGRGKAIMSANYEELNIAGKKLGNVLDENSENFRKMQEATRQQIQEIKDRYKDKAKLPPGMATKVKKLEYNLQHSRWSVFDSYDNHVQSTVMHEYGHIIADQYFGQINHLRANPHWREDNVRDFEGRWNAAFKKAKETGDIFKLSQYGQTNSHEFFAESFAAREMGEKLPDYVESLMKEVLDNGIM